MFKLFMLFNIFKHPVAADVVLMTSSDAKQSSMVAHDSSTELWNVILKVNQVLRLLMSCDIVKVNVFIAPFEIVDDSFIGELFLDDEDVLKEVNNSFFDVKVIEFCYHSFLVLKVSLVDINQSISFVNYIPDVIEHSAVCA